MKALLSPSVLAPRGTRSRGPVEHEGNQNSSPEEVEAVARIVADLLGAGVTWTDVKGKTQRLKKTDILVVAPYNARVAAIINRLPMSPPAARASAFL